MQTESPRHKKWPLLFKRTYVLLQITRRQGVNGFITKVKVTVDWHSQVAVSS